MSKYELTKYDKEKYKQVTIFDALQTMSGGGGLKKPHKKVLRKKTTKGIQI